MGIALLLIFPLYVQISNYRISKSKSYLNFASFFLFLIIDSILLSFSDKPLLLENISTVSFALSNFVLIIIASDTTGNKLPLSDLGWRVLAIFCTVFSLLIEILVGIEFLDQKHRLLHVSTLELLTFVAGLAVFYGFYTTSLVLRTSKTRITKQFWIIGGVLLILIGILQLMESVRSQLFIGAAPSTSRLYLLILL